MTPERVKDLQELSARIKAELDRLNKSLDELMKTRRFRDITIRAETKIRGEIRAYNWVLDQIEGPI